MPETSPLGNLLGEAQPSFEAQYRAAMEAAVVLDRSHLGRVAVAGADRESFLHNMLSADVKGTRSGAGRPATFLTPKAKLVSDLNLFREPGRFVIELEACRAAVLVEALSRYIISEDVRLETLLGTEARFSVEGPDASAILSRVTGVSRDRLDALGHLETLEPDPAEGGRVIVAKRREPSPRFDVVAAPELASVWIPEATELGAVSGGERLAETRRVEAGRPRYGIDLDDTTIPLEAGLDDAVSFDKGCYIGQEVIVRIAHRGHVNRKLTGLRLESSNVPPSGAGVGAGDEVAGHITSAARSPAHGVIALAYVKRAFWEPETAVTVEGCAGRVASLPFLA